jgi:hypothetical protein
MGISFCLRMISEHLTTQYQNVLLPTFACSDQTISSSCELSVLKTHVIKQNWHSQNSKAMHANVDFHDAWK